LAGHFDGEETEVEDAVPEAAVFVIEDGLRVGFWDGGVWGEEDGVFVECEFEGVESIGDDDVWVEIVDAFGVVAIGDVLEGGAFDGGAEFNDAVSEDPLGEVWDGEVFDIDDVVEGLGDFWGCDWECVGEYAVEGGVWVDAFDGVGECGGFWEVVCRDASEYVHLTSLNIAGFGRWIGPAIEAGSIVRGC
jgi:hypothetical protein